MNPIKAGWRTTEFWLALAAQAFGFLALFGVAVPPGLPSAVDGAIRIGGSVVGAAATVGYSFSRAKVKAPTTTATLVAS